MPWALGRDVASAAILSRGCADRRQKCAFSLSSRALDRLRHRQRSFGSATSIAIMDFAPYQDTAPDSTRALSPPPNRTSSPRNARSPSPRRPATDPFRASSPPAPNHFSDEPRGTSGFGGDHIESGRLDVNVFETSLPLRLDYEACLAYLLLPPAGGVFLLLVEHKSDYVRYVCYQMAEEVEICRSSQGTTCCLIEDIGFPISNHAIPACILYDNQSYITTV